MNQGSPALDEKLALSNEVNRLSVEAVTMNHCRWNVS